MTYYSALHYATKAEAAASTATQLLPHITSIDTVAEDITDVNTVAESISSVNTVATNMSDITEVATNVTDIITVATDIESVVAVAGDLDNIDAASGYAQEAKDWANKLGGTVDGTEYSAKKYAQDAAASAASIDVDNIGAALDYTGDTLSLENYNGDVLSSVTIQASAAADGKSITKNASDELQAIGVINQNDSTTAIKTWTGTKAQYDAIMTKDADTLYNITDDATSRTDIYSKTEVDSLMDTKANVSLNNVLANIDYVIETQLPTAQNNYTWYRKYKSGWVEQGGIIGTGTTSGYPKYTITLPVEMADTNYTVQVTGRYNTDTTNGTNYCYNSTTTTISIVSVGYGSFWEAKGQGAN